MRPPYVLVVTILLADSSAGASLAWATEIGDTSISANDSVADTPPLQRRVSLSVESMPLRDAFAEVCRQAGTSLDLDEDALVASGLDLGKPVTVAIEQESLAETLAQLIQLMNEERFTGAFIDERGDSLVISTIAATQARMKEQLPDWLKPLYNRGLLADTDDAGSVISVTAGEIVTDELLSQFATLPQLRKLHVESTDKLSADGIEHLSEMTALEKLSVHNVNVGGNGLGDEIIQAIAELPNLVELSIGECGTTDAGVRPLAGMQQLTRLELRQEGRLTDAALASIGKLAGLKHLNLSSYVATQQYGWVRFSADAIRKLAELKNLEQLHLVGHGVPADALTFDRLTSLSLGGNAVDDACAERIASCRQLESLNLSYTGITDAGLARIATLPSLRKLDIDSHLITDDGIAHLKGLQSLEHLSLRASRVSDDSLAHLAEVQSLARIDLHGSGYPGAAPGELFTTKGLERLKSLPRLRTLMLMNIGSPGGYIDLKELTQLRVLTFSMCDVTANDVSALEVALPNTMIHGASGFGMIRLAK
jgi:hypothetical protein